jgi:hypothetical protein
MTSLSHGRQAAVDAGAPATFLVADFLRCASCGQSADSTGLLTLLMCSACGNVAYCSVVCQRKDRKAHETVCVEIE